MSSSPEADVKERRSTPRARISVPVALHPVADSQLTDRQVESLNMSYLGMYFASTEEIPEGTKIEMRFEMPEMLALSAGEREALGSLLRTVLTAWETAGLC